jgi:hypothetical protein
MSTPRCGHLGVGSPGRHCARHLTLPIRERCQSPSGETAALGGLVIAEVGEKRACD